MFRFWGWIKLVNYVIRKFIIMKELRKIILKSVETIDKNFDENTSFKNLDVDSLDLYSIIQNIEDKYKMKINDKDLKKISSPKKLFAFLKKKNVF